MILVPGIGAPPVVAGIAFGDVSGIKDTSTLTPMPAHSAGMRLLLAAYRDGFVTPPGLAAGWNDIAGAGGTGLNSNSMRIGEKTAASSSEASGSWSNSNAIACSSFSGVVGIGASASNSGTTSTITIPALTLQNTDGTSWVFAGVGHRSGANSLASNTAALTYRGGYEGSGTEQDLALYDTNGPVAAFAAQTLSYATTSGWWAFAVELKAS